MCVLLLFLAQVCGNEDRDDINNYRRDTDALWRRGIGAEDGAFTATSLSILGWGSGLTAGIGLLASLLHQSTASHAHSTGHCCE